MSRDNSGASPVVAAQREMRPRERLIWAARPVPWTAIRKALRGFVSGLAFAAFALVWSGFAYIITVGDDTAFMFRVFPYFGIPFIFIGIVIAVAGLRSFRRIRSTLYAFSDQRLVIVSEQPRRAVRAIDLAAIIRIVRKEGMSGSGALTVFLRSGGGETLAGVPDVARVAAELDRFRTRASEAARAE